MVETQTRDGGSLQRQTYFINRKPASNMAHAVRVAEQLGLPLNRMVTFNFRDTACPEELVSQRFRRLRDNYFGKWLARKGSGDVRPAAYVWSIENSNGCINVHWLLHIPRGRLQDFQARLPDWFSAVAGQVTSNTAIDERAAPRPQGATKYMSKGIDPGFAEFFRIRHVPQGVVHGKRAGTSKALGPGARRHLEETGQMPRRVRRFRPFPVPPAAMRQSSPMRRSAGGA